MMTGMRCTKVELEVIGYERKERKTKNERRQEIS